MKKSLLIFSILTGFLFYGCRGPQTAPDSGTQQDIDAEFSISFSQIADGAPSLAGPLIYRSGTNGPTTRILTVDSPEQYSSIDWYINNITVQGASFTLNSANIAYNSIGEHILTLEVVKNSVPYNQTIIFTVAP